MDADDTYWRRPDEAATSDERPPPAPGADSTGPAYPGLSYPGPPRTSAPPSGWRPPHVIEPAPPRRLPVQDHARLDEEEARAQTLTRGVGIVVAAILVIVLCALCARALF